MKCTECNKEANQLHGERWSSKFGQIILKDELLCDGCASKRTGFIASGDLLRNKEKTLRRVVNQC